MSGPQGSDPRGPVESGTWPERLAAHVVSPTVPRRVHGYALVSDLARHYRFGEVAFTILSGEAPTQPWGEAIELAFTALAGTTVAAAPVHAATLSRRSTAPARTALAVGMLGLAEEADDLLHADEAQGPPDADAQAMWEQLPETVRTALARPHATIEALALAILRRAGLESDTQLVAAISLARIPALAAEVDAVAPGDVRSYPMRLPDFLYQDDDD